MTPSTVHSRLNSILAVVTVVLLIGLLLAVIKVRTSGEPSMQQVQVMESSSTSAETHGEIMLAEPTVKGMQVQTQISASSDDKDIVGYDIIVKAAPSVFTTVTARSLIPDFQVYTKKEGDVILITGVRMVSSTEKHILSNTPLVELSMTASSAGSVSLSVAKTAGSEVTKMVDAESAKVLPAVNEVSVAIE